jgi:hypothetical protein
MQAMGERRLWAVWIVTLSLCVVLMASAFHPGLWNSGGVTRHLAHARAQMAVVLRKL